VRACVRAEFVNVILSKNFFSEYVAVILRASHNEYKYYARKRGREEVVKFYFYLGYKLKFFIAL